MLSDSEYRALLQIRSDEPMSVNEFDDPDMFNRLRRQSLIGHGREKPFRVTVAGMLAMDEYRRDMELRHRNLILEQCRSCIRAYEDESRRLRDIMQELRMHQKRIAYIDMIRAEERLLDAKRDEQYRRLEEIREADKLLQESIRHRQDIRRSWLQTLVPPILSFIIGIITESFTHWFEQLIHALGL